MRDLAVIEIQWNLSNLGTIGTEEIVVIEEVSTGGNIHKRCTWGGNVSCLERCP